MAAVETMLALLKVDLMITTNAMDAFLTQLLTAAGQFITREGITLTESAEDMQLQEMYAAYLYRRRNDANPAMPRYLRYALNNRLLSQMMTITEEVPIDG